MYHKKHPNGIKQRFFARGSGCSFQKIQSWGQAELEQLKFKQLFSSHLAQDKKEKKTC